MDTALLFGGIAAVNRFVEFAKTYVNRTELNDDSKALVLRVLAVLGGILVVLISDGKVNILADVRGIHPAVAMLVTGFALGFGADFANALLGIFYGWKENPPGSNPPAEAPGIG